MEIFKCDCCHASYPIKLLHPEEIDLCLLCVAYGDFENADDYKERFVAWSLVEEYTALYKSLDLINGLHAEDLGLDL